MVAAGLLSTVLAVVLLTLDVGSTADGAIARMTSIARSGAAALFLTSGGLRLARWRVLREARSGQLGCALVVLGGLSYPLTGLGRALSQPGFGSLLSPLIRGTAAAVCMSLVLHALTPATGSTGVRPMRVLVRAACVVLGVFGGLTAAQVAAPGLLAGPERRTS